MSYSQHRVPVRGGDLFVGVWTPDRSAPRAPAPPTVLALHAVITNHRTWAFLAEALPGVRIIAPDFRGRSESGRLPAPYGLDAHVEDVHAVAAWFGLERVTGIGHALGAFVAVLASDADDLFSGMLLVDGGLPLAVPIPNNVPDHVAVVQGPEAHNDEFVFNSRDDYVGFWQRPPAFQDHWSPLYEAIVDHDMYWDGAVYRWKGNMEAIAKDQQELHGTARFHDALQGTTLPTVLMAAQRGLFDEECGVYSERQLARARKEYPRVEFAETPLNHFLAVCSDEGADVIAEHLVDLIALAENSRGDRADTQS